MVKKSIYLIMASLLVPVFCITSWAYWTDELKIRTDIPVVYDVSVEVEEAQDESSDKVQDDNLESEDYVIESDKAETKEREIEETKEEIETKVEAINE